jgi:putative transcriptional regulator
MGLDQMAGRAPEPVSADVDTSMAFLREFGRRIVRLREMRGWSRGDLARKLDVPRERLAKWERGAHEPRLAMIEPLGNALGVSVDELITGRPPSGKPLSPAERDKLSWHLGALRQFLR